MPAPTPQKFPLTAPTKILLKAALEEGQRVTDALDIQLRQAQSDVGKMKKAGLATSSIAVLEKNVSELRAKKKEAGPSKVAEFFNARLGQQDKELGKRQDKLVATLLKKIPSDVNSNVLDALVVICKILKTAKDKQDKVSDAFDQVTGRNDPIAHLLKGNELFLISDKALAKVEEVVSDLSVKASDNLRASQDYSLRSERNSYGQLLVAESKSLLKNMPLFDYDDLHSLLIPLENARDLLKLGALIAEGNPSKIDRLRDTQLNTDVMDAIPGSVYDFLDGAMWDEEVYRPIRATKKPKR